MTTVELLKAFPVGDPRRADILRQLGQQTPAAKRRSKYNARRTQVDGLWFDSNREAKHYQAIKRLWQAGEVRWFARQCRYGLPGGVEWVCDFVVVMKDGAVRVIDSKGMRTKEYKLKKRQVEAMYGVKIEEW